MFRHKGKKRTQKHNLRIATLLSFVAGMVNVAGFLAVEQLTTNVTGHFAFFVGEIYSLDIWRGMIYFLFVFFFLLGSFTTGFLKEYITRKDKNYEYTFPILIEMILILIIAVWGERLLEHSSNLVAYILLFAMGLQNSLVTLISNAVVRTTHLTGLVTDLGIEISQLFFYKKTKDQRKLLSSIGLRLAIVICFLLGGITSAVLYSDFGLHILILPVFLLLVGLTYDQFKLRVKQIQRYHRSRRL